MQLRRGIIGKELYRIIFFGVIFSVAAIGALAYWGVHEIRRDAAAVAVESSAKGLSGAVTVLVNAIKNSNEEISDGVLPSTEPAALRKEFRSVFKEHAQLSAVLVSDSHGLIYMLVRRPGGVVEVATGADRSEAQWTLFRQDGTINSDYHGWGVNMSTVNSALADELAHIKPGQVNWRSSNSFLDASDAWMTASGQAESYDGELLMLSFVFPVDVVVSQLGGAERGSAEKVFLYWKNGKALPVTDGTMEGKPHGSASETLAANAIGDPVIGKAVALLSLSEDRAAPVFFTVGQEGWWANVVPLSVFGDTLSLGVAVPRRNILSTLNSDSILQGGATALILFAVAALALLHRNRSRIEAMGMRHEAVVNEAELLALAATGESGRLEFKQTLRFNLKSGKNGKEIEHASLKTIAAFLNSEGGTLLIGVADDETVTGFAEDGFGSADHALLHLNNLISQYLGTEFSRFIDTAVIDVKGHQVLRVHCVPAPTPAIMTFGNNEEFFVRSGPASRQLTLSQFYEWLKSHDK